MQRDGQDSLRKNLIELLKTGNAHAAFEEAVEGIPPEHRGAKPAGSPHTLWQLVEHLRLAQHDILEFSRDPKHESPPFPDGYWPKDEAPPNDRAWSETIQHFRADLDAFVGLLEESKDLTAPIPHAPEGQSLLCEALTLADHNSYHLGQIALIRKMLGNWK
jgi:uncharacterized damage-inducible protein DinB